MKKLTQKKLIGFLTNLIFICAFFNSYASDLDDPSLDTLKNVLGNTFNIVVSLVGLVLVAVLAFGIWKSSMSLGDPRGLEGAKQTWTYALFGFMVIVLFFVIFYTILGFLGIGNSLTPKILLDKLFEALQELLDVPPNASSP
jgi:hypothetical protein